MAKAPKNKKKNQPDRIAPGGGANRRSDTGNQNQSGTGSSGGGQPPSSGNRPPNRRQPQNPSLHQMSEFAKKNKGKEVGRQARLAVAKGVTAGAGVGGISNRSTEAPKVVKDEAGKTVIPAGSIGYGGRTYTADNVEGLARAFNEKGLTLAQGLERNTYIAEGLGLDAKKLNQYVGARKARSKTARAMRKAKAGKSY